MLLFKFNGFKIVGLFIYNNADDKVIGNHYDISISK